METVETVDTVETVETAETEYLKKSLTYSLTDNLEARDAGASKKITYQSGCAVLQPKTVSV